MLFLIKFAISNVKLFYSDVQFTILKKEQIFKKYFNYPKILILVDFFLNKLLISGIKIIMNFFKEIMFTMKLKLKLVNPCKEYAK